MVKKAFQITIKNKYLWLFGFFAGASGGGYNFYSGGSGSGSDYRGKSDYGFDQFGTDIKNYFLDHWILIVGLAILFIGIMLFFMVMRILSQGALIGAVNKIDSVKSSSLRDGFKIGRKYFWRILGLGLLTGLAVFLALVILGTPIIFLFIYKMYVRGIILVLLGLAIFIPLSIVVNYATLYGYRYIVLYDKKIIQALKSAFDLFIKNIWQSIVFSLILFLVGIATAIAAFIILFAIAIPFIILGFLAYFVAQWIGAVIVSGLAFVIFIGLMFVLGAIIATFQSSLWTLAFKDLIKR